MGKQRASRTSTRAGAKRGVVLEELVSEETYTTETETINFTASEPVHPHPTTTFEIGTHPVEEDVPLVAREINLFGPSDLDRAVFCRQLATLIEVGIPLLRALQMLARRTAHSRLSKGIRDVARRVEEGQSVSQAMDANVRVFSPLVCNIVRVGETGGILETSLVRLAQIMESRADMKRKVGAALMYPAVALIVAFCVIAVILIKAVPKFASVYAEAKVELPRPTRFVLGMSHLASHYFYVWVILFAAAAWFIWWGSKTPRGKEILSFLALRTPIISRINQKIAVARFSRTLSGLLSAGVPLIESIAIAADTNENTLVSDALRKVHAGVQRGEKITRPLAQENVMPPLVIDMISIGEETGTLDTMLTKIADIYDAEVDAILRGLASIIEPLLIVFLGGIVILIALAVFLPYFHLVEVIQ